MHTLVKCMIYDMVHLYESNDNYDNYDNNMIYV